MIPKIIHYCWFGGTPLPKPAEKCIESWRKFLPDYEIKEWNESNFDINVCDYVREAYEAKKWAFVSDYARFWILYRYGGLYFDTDVELIKPIDDIIAKGPFMGLEPQTLVQVAPGLGLGANPGLGLYKEILDKYNIRYFKKNDGSFDFTTVVTFVTDILKGHGFIEINKIQEVSGIKIYPTDYFCPKNYDTGEMTINANTRSIHHFSASWQDEQDHYALVLRKKLLKVLPFTFSKSLANAIAILKYQGMTALFKKIKEKYFY